jgi:phosphate/sulfate permease
MFGLEASVLGLLIICLALACAFEFVNGFHDTANAVATVIYTKSLKPTTAVILSGSLNFLGVLLGGIGVAMGIVNLLPLELLVDTNIYHGVAMVLALMISAIIWNLGTWYFGIPSSSSHTMIGAVLGIGIGFALLPENNIGDKAINYDKALDTLYALGFSPFFGFVAALLLMLVLRLLITSKKAKKALFKEPDTKKRPPLLIRIILICTCSLVSFFHGSNDGQKGVGLVMLILITLVPNMFSINPNLDIKTLKNEIVTAETTISQIDTLAFSEIERESFHKVAKGISKVKSVAFDSLGKVLSPTEKLDIRKAVMNINKHSKIIIESESINRAISSKEQVVSFKEAVSKIKNIAEYAPSWVILMISLSLGLGTMIGWKRIVVTIGEKIGKEHLTYAQGMTAEVIASLTIGLATWYKAPVSTTHSLSSAIAGSMVASKGVKNLQGGTVKTILLAWLFTLPVTITLSASMFLFFRWLIG